MKESRSDCTTILVGKNATIDGSTIISRNEDSSFGACPKKFIVVEPKNQPRTYQAKLSKVKITLPPKREALRYTCTPDAIGDKGIWGESGINSENVAMSATETITSNPRILGVDPLVEDGIGEEDMLTLVLPYVHSAKEGVLRLGSILEEYGTYEMNGIAFSDKDEVWYLETYGGHQWAAVRIPDDAYVVAPNRTNIDEFDFDSDYTLSAPGLKELIENHHLNPDHDKYNFRHIFGSSTIKDTRYNNPRAWYVQKYFDAELPYGPEEQELPFICHAKRRISIEDVKWLLSSHYQNTDFDPYGPGTESKKKRYRPIGINRNQEGHILQIRNDVPKEIAGIHWVFVGPNTFNAAIPFYANVNDTPACYRDVSGEFDLKTVFWLTRTLAVLGDTDYDRYSELEASFEEKVVSACRNLQLKADQVAVTKKNPVKYLTEINNQMAEIDLNEATKLLGDMVDVGGNHMKLKFDLHD